jgi:hypothetical protein
MSQLIGIGLMIVTTILLMKYVSSMKQEMKDLGKQWWLVIIGEIFTGVSVLLVIGFFIGFLLVITPFK